MTKNYFSKEKSPQRSEINIDDEKENEDDLFKHPGDFPGILSTVNRNVRVDNWLHDQFGIDIQKNYCRKSLEHKKCPFLKSAKHHNHCTR